MSSKNLKIVMMALICGSVLACAPQSMTKSRVRDLAADPTAKNVALVFGAPNDLQGVDRDVEEVSKVFANPALGFKVVTKNRATASDFMKTSAEVAATLDANSTLFWYYSGHGSDDGSLFAQDEQSIYVKEVIAEIKKVRTTPFKRMIIVMDSCFSGQNVDGQEAIITGSAAAKPLNAMVNNVNNDIKVGGLGLADGNQPFEQALVIAAARSDQTSMDQGDEIGGAFTYAWRAVLKEQLADKSKTVRNMLDATIAAAVADVGSEHTPVYRASPSSLLDEKLTGNGGSIPSVPNTNTFDAFLALAGANQQAPVIWASTPASFAVTSAILCKGDAATCRSSAQTTQFSVLTSAGISGRTILSSANGVALTSGAVYTMIFKDSKGVEVGARSIKATSH